MEQKHVVGIQALLDTKQLMRSRLLIGGLTMLNLTVATQKLIQWTKVEIYVFQHFLSLYSTCIASDRLSVFWCTSQPDRTANGLFMQLARLSGS